MNKRMVIISIIIFLFASYLNVFPFHEVVPMKKAFSDFPLHWKGWVGEIHQLDDVVLEKLRVSDYTLREYRKGHNSVTLYIGYYGAQGEGAQIHSPKHCLPGGGWFKVSEKIRTTDINNNKVRFVEAVYQKANSKEMFIYWYKMKNAFITNEYTLKLYMILNSLKYRRNDAAFIRLSSSVISNSKDTSLLIENFMKDFLPLFKDYLPE